MRALALIVTLVVMPACVDDSVIEKAAEECQEMLDEVIPTLEDEIWSMCTDFYEGTIIPAMASELDKKMNELESDIMHGIGCVEDPDEASGWDCSESYVCDDGASEPPPATDDRVESFFPGG